MDIPVKGWEAIISMMVTIPSVVYKLPVFLTQLIARGSSGSQEADGGQRGVLAPPWWLVRE